MNSLVNAIELQPGIFKLDLEMPGKLEKIVVSRYHLNAAFANPVFDELAARFIWLSQEMGQWVAVSNIRLLQMLDTDLLLPESERPTSQIYQQGIPRVMNGILDFTDMGFLGHVRGGTSNLRRDVYYPTTELVQYVRVVQHLA